MIFYLVAYIAWVCPGGWLSGFVPDAIRPIACQGTGQVEQFDRLEKAKDRVRELGRGSRLISCRGFRCKEVPVTWVTEPQFREVKP